MPGAFAVRAVARDCADLRSPTLRSVGGSFSRPRGVAEASALLPLPSFEFGLAQGNAIRLLHDLECVQLLADRNINARLVPVALLLNRAPLVAAPLVPPGRSPPARAARGEATPARERWAPPGAPSLDPPVLARTQAARRFSGRCDESVRTPQVARDRDRLGHTRRCSQLIPPGPATPLPAATPQAVATARRTFEEAAAKIGVKLDELTIYEPDGVAASATLRSTAPAGFLKHEMPIFLAAIGDRWSDYDGVYLRVVDGSGSTVWETSTASRIMTGSVGSRVDLAGCSPVANWGGAPRPCSAG